jgi:hypothetical protein
MKNEVLDKIKRDAVNTLKDAYGYCGLADNDDGAWLNSDDNQGHDITIKITSKETS